MNIENFVRIIEKHYDFNGKKIHILEKLDNGWDNQNLLLEIDNQKYVLRKYMITPECDVNEEIKLIKLLNKPNFPCFYIIRDKENNAVVSDDGCYLMYKYIEAVRKAQLEDMDKIIETINKLHVITFGFNTEVKRNRYEDIENKFIRFVRENKYENLENMGKLLDFINGWLANEKKIILNNDNKLRKCWVHHDINPDNLLISADGKLNIIDFDECLYASYLLDIISIFHYWCLAEDGTVFNMKLAENILSKYNSLTPISADELRILPYLMVQFQLDDTLFYIKSELEENSSSITDVTQSYSFQGLMLLYNKLKENKLVFNLSENK